MRFALIKAGQVVNVAIFDDIPGDGFGQVVSLEGLDPQPSVGWTYNGTSFEPPPEPVAPALLPHVSVGAFKDRLGMDALAIAVSAHPVCVALREMLYDRKRVELDRPDVLAFLNMLIAASQPAADPTFPGSGPMTVEKRDAILGAPVQDGERP